MISLSDALYTCLLTDLGFPEGDPSPFSNSKDYAKAYLARDVFKKLLTRVSDQADRRALDKFIAVNQKCREWKKECEGSWDDELIGSLKETIYKFWNPGGYPLVSSYAECLSQARSGPGASIGANGNDFYTKMFSSKLTCTSSHLYDVYRRNFDNYPIWRMAELSRSSEYGSCEVVRGSRLSFVPKTNDISRTICVEPSLNMFYQLGFGACLEDRLETYFGISLARQPDINRKLAYWGSIDGSFSTIDLSSASDSLGMEMLREVLPKDFLSWLTRLRSPFVQTLDGELELAMVSTMGNGFTFPLQTMLFASIVVTALRHHGIDPKMSLYYPGEEDSRVFAYPNYSVFGDDIICPSSVTRTVLRLLKMLGFQVNRNKTFVEGPFRESCGHDYFLGRNVRPVYIRKLTTQQDRYVAINALNEWTARTGVILPTTVQFLMSTVRYLAVPYSENQDAGIRMPFNLVRVPIQRDGNGSCMYKARRAKPVKVRVLDGEVLFPKSMRRRRVMYNPDGLYLAFLHGDIEGSSISVRHDRVHYYTKNRITPNWDWCGTADGVAPSLSWQRWNTAVFFNCYS